jgi:Rha family phage regulatory protein
MNELVTSKKQKVYAESQVVAEVFEKEHFHILRDIRELEKVCSPEFWLSNFGLSEYKVRGKVYPCYHLTRDGFTMLAMGFTGEKAIQFKELYIKRFNEMESYITSLRLARLEFKDLTDNIQLMHDPAMNYHYSNETDMINKIVLGMSAKQYREANGIVDKASIRPYLTAQQIKDIEELQRVDTGFVVAIPDYQERKELLLKYYRKTRNIELLE